MVGGAELWRSAMGATGFGSIDTQPLQLRGGKGRGTQLRGCQVDVTGVHAPPWWEERSSGALSDVSKQGLAV